MDKFLIKKQKRETTPLLGGPSTPTTTRDARPSSSGVLPIIDGNLSNSTFDASALISDPGVRPPIASYSHNIRDEVRRAYLQNEPTQPIGHAFKTTKFGSKNRRFNPKWFQKYPFWLEYSVKTEKAYCLCCYLFNQDDGGTKSFVDEGYCNWKKPQGLKEHEGCGPNSGHNLALSKCNDLMDSTKHYDTFVRKKIKKGKGDYRIRLKASIKCIIYLLKQGLAFRGHDESVHSNNHGNFLELLAFHADVNEEVQRVVLENAPQNCKMTSPDIQKDIVSSVAYEIIKFIIRDIGDALFAILVDEARDVSTKEQMAVVIRYVDKKGQVIERLVGIRHVKDTKASTLRDSIVDLLISHGLCVARLRGQGYDGASNMQGEFNGLKALILDENPYAFYVHCFAHQLQLALVGLARKHESVEEFFGVIYRVLNVVGGSCKRVDILKKKQLEKVEEALNCGELSSGRGLNQETNLQRPGDTRWSSHYRSLVSLVNMFSPVIDVLEIIGFDGKDDANKRVEAKGLLDILQTFEFVFMLHLMRDILGVTNLLSQALQRKDQDIMNAMNLVELAKLELQNMRENGWKGLVDKVSSFCEKNEINVVNMEDMYVAPGRVRRKLSETKNEVHFRINVFVAVIDMQDQELRNRFNVASTELLTCMSCLSPTNSFAKYDKDELIHFAQFYPLDFFEMDCWAIQDELQLYIREMRRLSDFSNLNNIGDLAKKLVDTGKDKMFPLVYKLITLALILPVATASVERSFSAMNIVKNQLRNRMCDTWMNDSLICYVEKDILKMVDYEAIMQKFHNMKPRRGDL